MLIKQDKQKGKRSYSLLFPIYPLLAQQFVDDYNLNVGICMDIGTGNGYVGTELAKITNMNIYFVDKEIQGLEFAQRTTNEAEIDNKVFFVEADVCAGLPFADQFADFIVSRGSLWFWEDKIKGIAEVYRVLK
ncbi:MAG: class I SAM-dependent methyltransferase, partial [Syntrophomonas sp.]|nr:class I SAM-dependent methyltransferase [Syntrophomonas sp.]